MKFTCLSKGGGYHFPPCHILDICGFRILLDCPLDLSALTIFSPTPSTLKARSLYNQNPNCSTRCGPLDLEEPLVRKKQKVEKPIDADDLIYAVPRYKTVTNLDLWNTSFIDVVLISSPMGMLGLPFLTRMKGFSAKIYVTEATARLGQLMMEDLVSMHMEIRQLLGPDESCFPHWLKGEELKLLPSSLRDVALGKDGGELGGWKPLYSAGDLKDCMKKVRELKYAQETCYNSKLIIKAFSSGLEIGTCNWTINGPKGGVAFISSSIVESAPAMNFDYIALKGNDTIIYSDFSLLDATEDVFNNCRNDGQEIAESLHDLDDSVEENEKKLDIISSHVIESVNSGGSVLIPISRLGIVLQLLEQISAKLDVSALKVPIYMISSVAEELLNFTNIKSEWLCKQRQEMVSKQKKGQEMSLFGLAELIKEKKLHVFPAVHSPKLLMNWQEPCIVFSPHWSLRLGPAVHFLRRWCGDPNSLLVMENELDIELSLLPFKPMAIKVLPCSFLSGIRLKQVQPLLRILQPKVVLFPKDLRPISSSNSNAFSIFHYCINETLRVPSLKDMSELKFATHLVSNLDGMNLKQGLFSMKGLNGELSLEDGRQRLISGNVQESSENKLLHVHCGSPDKEGLLAELSSRGIKAIPLEATRSESENTFAVHVNDPGEALIQVRETSTVIATTDVHLAYNIFAAIESVLDGI